jgi:pimeloyl-ACP methyl ester carboxylesterase
MTYKSSGRGTERVQHELPKLSSLLLWGLLAKSAMAASHPMTLDEYMALRGPKPEAQIAYGAAPQQFVQLFEPAGGGPFPVVVLVHGGCFLSKYQGIGQMGHIAGALAADGIAVWNIEYRRADELGGGYPGTFQDISAALRLLAKKASDYHLDLTRFLVMGHSAGAYLAQWSAGRRNIPEWSPLHENNPIPIRTVIAAGDLGQGLKVPKTPGSKTDCGAPGEELLGPLSAARTDANLDIGVDQLRPNGSHTIFVAGELDKYAPISELRAYATRIEKMHDSAEVVVLPGASHFDEIAASQPAWKLLRPIIRNALGLAVDP